MEINLEVCRTVAAQYGLPLQYAIKEFYVFDVLGQITAAVAGQEDVVFKGGTALNKVYLGKLQRFSEDLDFDISSERSDTVYRWCKEIAKQIEGYRISEFRRLRDTVQFYCVYDSQLGTKDHVRIDVAAKKIICEKPPLIKPAFSLYTQRYVSGFLVYTLEDLLARKLHALRTRSEGKDLYDVFNALPLCGKMDEAIAKMLESEGISETPAEFLRRTVSKLGMAEPKKLRSHTNQFIPLGRRPADWLELKNELILRLEGLLLK